VESGCEFALGVGIPIQIPATADTLLLRRRRASSPNRLNDISPAVVGSGTELICSVKVSYVSPDPQYQV
jgi:hypothetical protein